MEKYLGVRGEDFCDLTWSREVGKGKGQEWHLTLQRERLGGQYRQQMGKHVPEEPIREQDQCG